MSEKKFYSHPTALVASDTIGDETRIWAYSNVQQNVVIGSGCNICDHCFVEQNVRIGNDVTIKNGVSLWDGMTIEDKVFIGPNAVFTNDVFPRSKLRKESFDKILIKEGATIGANATVVANHTIGRYAFVGAGAVVTSDVPDYTIWYGNPARLKGYICACTKQLEFVDNSAKCDCGLAYKLVDGLVIPL